MLGSRVEGLPLRRSPSCWLPISVPADARSSLFFSCVADELRMVTVCHCGRSRVLTARLRSVSCPIRHVTRAIFLYIRGRDLDFSIIVLGPSCRFPLCAVDSSTPVDYRAGVCVQVSIGSSAVLAPSASLRYQVGHSCHALCLSGFVGCG